MIITIINIWRGECHYNLPYLHRPHDSGPIQRARGDFRLKPSAAARPPARSVSLFLFQSRNVEQGRHEEQGMRQKTERKGEDERKKAQWKGCKSPSQKEGGVQGEKKGKGKCSVLKQDGRKEYETQRRCRQEKYGNTAKLFNGVLNEFEHCVHKALLWLQTLCYTRSGRETRLHVRRRNGRTGSAWLKSQAAGTNNPPTTWGPAS